MSYLGRYAVGQYVPLLVQCRDGAGVPQVPTDCPWVTLWDATGKVVKRLQVPVTDRYVPISGLFFLRLRVDGAFSAGMYRATVAYLIGSPVSYRGTDDATFEVLEYGDSGGNVLAMHFFNRPWGAFLVQELDGGKLTVGRNPKL